MTLPEALTGAIAFHHTGGDRNEARRLGQLILNAADKQFEALHYFGVREAQRGQLETALCLLARAVEVDPGHCDAQLHLGNVLTELGRHADALARYDQALCLQPGYAQAYANRGAVLLELGRYDEAMAACDRALVLQPDFAEAHYNRGNVLLDIKRYAEALASYDRALGIRPDHARALSNRGNALVKCTRHAEALASYDRALALDPANADTLNSLGNALQELKRYAEAIARYEEVLKLRPEYEYALGMRAYAQLQCADWRTLEAERARLAAAVQSGKCAILPFAFLALSSSAADQLTCAKNFVRESYPVSVPPLWQGEHYGHQRIRVAYVSADFRNHPVAHLLVGLFERHDRSQFETIAISFGPDEPGAMRTRLEGAFEHFIDVNNRSDQEVAALLRELEVDIAVDLMGYMQNCRTGIFAFNAAPIQVNYLGFPGTLGADYIHYVIADQCVIPADQHACYTEKVVYLPDTYLGTSYAQATGGRAPSRIEAGLPETGIVFCSFNNGYKITPEIFAVWMRLLGGVEDSVLWLREPNAASCDNLRAAAKLHGINPDRIIFAARAQRAEDHLARHQLADLFLDTLPYNAHTTASDALWAGLPVVTCAGTTFAGRVAASLLHAAGLPELITHTLDEYSALALKLATDANLLAEIKAKLARNRDTCPLFDTDRFRRHIEAAYVTMWERCERGESPAGFAVEALPPPGAAPAARR